MSAVTVEHVCSKFFVLVFAVVLVGHLQSVRTFSNPPDFFQINNRTTFLKIFPEIEAANSMQCLTESGSFSNSSMYRNIQETFQKAEPPTAKKTSTVPIQQLWTKFPLPLTFLNEKVVSEGCRNATKIFTEGLQKLDMRYLKMFDATAKLPSGLLSGNTNQYGNYDQCLSISNARYCLTELDFNELWKNSGYEEAAYLVHSHYFIKSTFEDPGHRIPGSSMIRWGICMPSACSPEDLQRGLEKQLKIRAKVDPAMCAVVDQKKNEPLTYGDYFARLFFAGLLTLITIASGLHRRSLQSPFRETTSGKLLNAFAIQENWKKLTNTEEERNELRGVNGIRCLSALALLLCHKNMAGLYSPYVNRTSMAETLGMYWSIIGRTAIIYTDSFMLLSGLLNARSLLNSLKKDGCLHFKDKLITRIFRISPNIIAVILFCTYILPNIGSGPLWPQVVDHHSILCKSYMWRNIFFIHNYFGFENMCLTHTHQVGIDMQLFLSTPFFIYLIWKNKRLGLWTIALIAMGSTALRFTVTYYKNLSSIIYPGYTVKQAFETSSLSYILPTHRATIYIMGIFMAILFETPVAIKITSKLTKGRASVCWLIGISLGILAMFGGPNAIKNLTFVHNKLDAAIYAAFSPIWWGLCMIWVAFSANNGYGGWLGNFLSWKGFRILTRLSYSFYLTQFPIFFYNIGRERSAGYYRIQNMFELPEVASIFFFSILLTLSVELPFQKIKRILFDKNNKTTKTLQKEVSNCKASLLTTSTTRIRQG